MKKVLLLLISIVFMFLLSGCNNATQLNEKLILQSIGVDILDDEYLVTVQALNIKNIAGKDSNSSKKVDVLQGKGHSMQDALSVIKSYSGKEPLYSQTLVLVIGEDAAKEGVGRFIGFFVKHYEFSPAVEVLIAHGTAFDILNTEINGEIINAEKVISFLKKGCDNTNQLNSNLGSFVADLKKEHTSSIAAHINAEEVENTNNLVVNKIAIFDKDKLVDHLDEKETKGYLLVKGKAEKMTDIVHSSEYQNVTYTVTKSKSKRKIELVDGNLIVNICINMELFINESEVAMGEKKDFSDIEDLVKEKVTSLAQLAIDKSIMKNGLDIFGFSSEFIKYNFSKSKDLSKPLIELLKNAEYNITVTPTVTSDK